MPKGIKLDDARLSCADLAGLPPAYVITAGYDPLKDEGAAYVRRIRNAGGTATHVKYPGMIHGFISTAMVPVAS